MLGIFGRAKAGQKLDNKKWSEEAIMRTPLHDLLHNIVEGPETIPSNAFITITQRLIEIIYEDETISDEDRERARGVVNHVINTQSLKS